MNENISKMLKSSLHILNFIVLGLLFSFLSNILLDWLHNGFDFHHVKSLILSNLHLYMIGTTILFVIYIWLAAIFGSKYISTGLLLFFSFSLGMTSQVKMAYRGEPLYPVELRMFTALPEILEMIAWQELIAYIILIILLLSLFVFGYFKIVQKREKIFPTKVSYTLRSMGIVIASFLLIYIYQFNESDNIINASMSSVTEWKMNDQARNYSSNGFVAGFIFNFQSSPMERIDSYSSESITHIVEKYTRNAEMYNKNRSAISSDVNVIFIMNETHSDPLRLNGIEINKDPIPFFRELTNNTISGQSMAQGIGGGTANSEFEALTTMSMEAFAPTITTPYVQLTNQINHMPNIVQMYKEMDYHTTAIHSHNTRLYRRKDVYNNMGFDEFLYDSTMTHTHRIKEDHYISDDAAYKEILEVLNQNDQASFIHLVTMQNHMPHDSKYNNPDFETTGSGRPHEANAYFQDLYHSDEALASFISEINAMEEDILVVFWGDHLPHKWRVYGDEHSAIRSLNDERTFYETEYFIYSNFVELDGDIGIRSPIYFNNHVMEILDLKISPYQALLLELESVLPAFRDGIYVSENQDHVEHKEELDPHVLEILNDYYLIQYDITSGNRYSSNTQFFER
jgi:phosphoglycerol transferase MdoB-like AlkP superfamily enzyme